MSTFVMGKLENTVASKRVYHVSTMNDNKVKASVRDRYAHAGLVPPRLAKRGRGALISVGFSPLLA